MTVVRLTHVGGPTLLIEIGGWRLLTDPTFDPPGRRYDFGWGTSSRKIGGPALGPADVGDLDAVLLTHDHHGDNLDDAGRALLETVPAVVTTTAAARRLESDGRVVGLSPGATTTLTGQGRTPLEITATPCRHGPPLSRPVVGDVIGFAVDRAPRTLWISGDTVVHRGLLDVATRLTVDTAVLHLGGVRFPLTGPIRYSMTARDAIRIWHLLRPRALVPVHYEGWTHFDEGRADAQAAFDLAPDELRESLHWLEPGVATDMAPRARPPGRGRRP